MKDLLNNALSEISDRHIEEAAKYETKAKSITLKRILLSIAACFVILITGALTVQFNPSPDIPSFQESDITSATTAGVIDESTTVAGGPEIISTTLPTTSSAEITEPTTSHMCPPLYSSWEEAPLFSSSPTITFKDRLYVGSSVNNPLPFDRAKIKGVLTETTVTGYADGYEKVPVIASICEIDGIDIKDAIVIIRNDGLQRGHNVYISKELLYDSTDFNDILEKLDYRKNLILSRDAGGESITSINYYKKSFFSYISEYIFSNYHGTTEHFEFENIEEEAILKRFMDIFQNKDTVKIEHLNDSDIDTYQFYAQDSLEFTVYLCGYPMEAMFTEEGKLYFFAALNDDIQIVCYNFSESDFDYFLTSCYNPQPDYPTPDNTLRSVIGTSQTLSDIINFADITNDYKPQSFCTEFQAYYKGDGKDDITYSISIKTMEELASLIISNSDAKSEERTGNTDEKLTFNAYLNGSPCEIYLCNDGYLYFNADGLTRAFNIGVENYERFITTFTHIIWTPENPVTMG